jgi:predicted nuclease with RNAse H fold
VIQEEAETSVQRAAGKRCGSREMIQRARVVDLVTPPVRRMHARLDRTMRDGEIARTGVTVVSSHPQSTTSPVMRPQAARASTDDGVNATEGTCDCQRNQVLPVPGNPRHAGEAC